MKCLVCDRDVWDTVTAFNIHKSFSVCPCSHYCYDCFLEKYVLFNSPPSALLKRCRNWVCRKALPKEQWVFIFKFTIDYFSSEFCYF